MRKISDILHTAREDQKLSLDEVERSTKIKKIYLRAIEEGKFHNLPSESYALGFVKNYARFLGISMGEAVPLFRREYNARNNVHIVPNFRKTQHKFNRKFFLNSKSFLVAAAAFLVIVYILFQYSSLVFAPKLNVISPKNGAQISGSVVEVSGKTDSYATLTIDGEEVYVDLTGSFKKSLYLFTGDEKIDVVAKNRFGKENKQTIHVKIK